MVIKIRSIINKCVSIGVCLLLGFSIYRKCMHNTVSPSSLVITSDEHILSEKASQDVTDFMQAHHDTLHNPLFSQELISRFPCLQSYSLEKNASGNWICTTHCALPRMSVNNTLVLTDAGNLALKADYSQASVDSLYNIIVPQGSVSPALCSSIAHFSSHLLEQYQMVWMSDQEALLYDREQPYFAIRFNALALPHDDMMHTCVAIKRDLEQRNLLTHTGKKKPQLWIADIRFKDQIVVSSQNVGGVAYG